MKYFDLHTDALTKKEGVFHVTREKLAASGCAVQCFAAFIPDPAHGFAAACSLADAFSRMCEREGYIPLRRMRDFSAGRLHAIFTVEGGGAIEGDVAKLEALYARGARLLTLTWNYPNALGYPNFLNYGGPVRGHGALVERQGEFGLTPLGRDVVVRMGELGVLADVSHGSDKLFYDVAAISRARGVPFVASHSGADAVCRCPRNLTDEQISLLADRGGVVGLDFCADFLSADKTAAGQEQALLRHAEHILGKGGEDVLAIGSDFDGIPTNAFMRSASDMPRLFEVFSRKFGPRVTEKIAFSNAFRVFSAVMP